MGKEYFKIPLRYTDSLGRITEPLAKCLWEKSWEIPYEDIIIQSKKDTSVCPKVSFCTTCKGRTWQLKQAYIKNIEDNMDYPNVEFVLLNYGSPDDMDEWVKDNLFSYIEKGIVKYYRLIDDMPWHVSIAKNMAHRLASGEILCNLDADNFTGKDFAWILKEAVSPNYAAIRTNCLSATGRIAVHREDFFRLGGYDESFAPMRHQDIDLIDRMKRSGIQIFPITEGPIPIPNSNEERIRFCEQKSFSDCDRESMTRMQYNIKNGITVVNTNGFAKEKCEKVC